MNFKGHATIELTDVKTKKKQVIEEDNTFTNFLSSIVNNLNGLEPLGNSNQDSPYVGSAQQLDIFPLIERGIGGLLLFSNPLTENPNKYKLEQLPMGCAAQGVVNATADTRMGSYNTNESGSITNGFRYVYDFATSQGNGQIAALSLCHKLLGNNFPGNREGLANQSGSSIYRYQSALCTQANCIDTLVGGNGRYDAASIAGVLDGHLILAVKEKGDSSKNITFYKTNYAKDVIRLTSVPLRNRAGRTYTKLGTVTLTNSYAPRYAIGCQKSATTCYIAYLAGNSGAGTSIKISEIDYSTLQIVNTIDLTSPVSVDYWIFNTESNGRTMITPNYLWMSPNNTHDLYKIKISDGTYVKFTATNPKSSNYFTHIPNMYSTKFLCFESLMINVDTDEYENLEWYAPYTTLGQYNYGPAYQFPLLNDTTIARYIDYQYSWVGGIAKVVDLAYLATINNLQTPVTKTAAQTMKITYTVTEAS